MTDVEASTPILDAAGGPDLRVLAVSLKTRELRVLADLASRVWRDAAGDSCECEHAGPHPFGSRRRGRGARVLARDTHA